MSNIKLFLKRWPAFYHLLQKIYYSFRRVIETHIFGTKIQEWIWKTRHIYKGGDWIKGYCESINHPHRQFLVTKISSLCYAPIESILEIGCNAGPNLYLLAKKFPEAKLYGIDINSHAIKKGKLWLNQIGIRNVELFVGRADELEEFDDKSMDVVFTDATLLYIGPDKIEKVVSGLIRVARKALFLNEWHSDGKEQNGCSKALCFYYEGHWVYNYKALFQKFVTEDKIRISKIPQELWPVGGWEELGAIIEVRL